MKKSLTDSAVRWEPSRADCRGLARSYVLGWRGGARADGTCTGTFACGPGSIGNPSGADREHAAGSGRGLYPARRGRNGNRVGVLVAEAHLCSSSQP